MNQHKIIFIDLLDILSYEPPLLVQHLSVCDDPRLRRHALLVLLFELRLVLADQELVVETDRVLVRFVPLDDLRQFLTFCTIPLVLTIILLFLQRVALKLSSTDPTLPPQLFLLPHDPLHLYFPQRQQI